MKMHRYLFSLFLLLAIVLLCTPAQAAEEKILSMSTTTSTQASGLLDVLLPELEKDTGIRVKVLAKGTGAALRDGMDGNVDVLFVHAIDREKAFVDEGYGTKRYAVMHNDFIIIGPADDPAHIKGAKDAAEALKLIAQAGAIFVSRGDDSGTHTKEQELWGKTGLPIETKTTTVIKDGKESKITFSYPKTSGQWYMSIGQGMGKTLTFAEEKRGYCLADRGTYVKYKFDRPEGLNLEILCENDALLFNPYGVIPVNPKKFPHVKYKLAEQFAQWLISPRGQKLIADYKLAGKQLFFPDAELNR